MVGMVGALERPCANMRDCSPRTSGKHVPLLMEHLECLLRTLSLPRGTNFRVYGFTYVGFLGALRV